jgi:hypothetical protein
MECEPYGRHTEKCAEKFGPFPRRSSRDMTRGTAPGRRNRRHGFPAQDHRPFAHLSAPDVAFHREILRGRRRYVLLRLALAVLEAADAQTTLGRLAEKTMSATAWNSSCPS